MVSSRDEVFPCKRGSTSEFFIKILEPAEVTGPTIVFLHDLFDYHGVYLDFAEQLAQAGHTVHLIDFPGFGRSSGARGVIDRHDDLIDNIEEYLISLPENVILGGHAFGALISIRVLHRQGLPAQKALLGLILSNPLLRMKQGIPEAGRFVFERLRDPFDLVPLPWKLSSADRGSSLISDDPLVRNQLILRSFREVEKLTKLEQNASYLIDVPTLTMLPGSDTIGSISYARLFTKAIDPELSKVIEYERQVRDLLANQSKPEAVKDVLTWLKERY
tara:strand:- start:29735 stop:30559 length:825 start_codon:yes stop_codon:yes gene_type:complete